MSDTTISEGALATLGLLTDAEHRLVETLGVAMSIFAQDVVGDDETTRDNDLNEFASRIHDLQARVLMHAAARAYPQRYRLNGGPAPKGPA